MVEERLDSCETVLVELELILRASIPKIFVQGWKSIANSDICHLGFTLNTRYLPGLSWIILHLSAFIPVTVQTSELLHKYHSSWSFTDYPLVIFYPIPDSRLQSLVGAIAMP